ncbi:MAG: hypothetical protein JNM93_12115 [Bacteriovoracaceae bacterium]|nr:hypothetical protein [Bacteriovoracaceae bacterium]
MKFAFLFLVLFSACIAPVPTRDPSSNDNSSCNGGDCSNPGNGGIGGGSGTPVAKVEMRHLVNPYDGTYTRKLTIPKNYRGELYLSGLNFQTLRDKHLFVKFKFGMAQEEITYEATLGRGQGITPSTEIDVLILDLSQAGENGLRFDDIRLLYDLYDYNDYDFTAGDEPVQNNLNTNLFCRGLYLADDPSFQGSGSCSGATSECRYSYAKILDKGLMKNTSGVYLPIVPSQPMIEIGSLGYTRDTTANSLKKCLSEKGTQVIYDSNAANYLFNAIGSTNVIGGTTYRYDGPYRSLNTGLWQISGSAMYSKYGLFEGSLSGADANYGYSSYLFPRYTKLNLTAGVEHVATSSTDAQAAKSIVASAASGATGWMDGCNTRVQTLDPVLNEHYGSCNVSATIEIYEKVASTGEMKLIADSDDGGKDVKLQLTKSSQLNTSGSDVLFSALRQCSSSSACSSDECCYNNRCWSKGVVSLCPETVSGTGGGLLGEICATDFDCSSLCCSTSTSRCAVHNNSLEPPVLCSKPFGQICIAKEWCMEQTVSECYIVKTGFTVLGAVTCEVRCYNVSKFGDCVNGVCVPPTSPSVPVFNPTDPNACAQAIDPPY